MGFLNVENVSKKFGKTIAVDNVSFDINKGTFLTLLGPSGCGKTTTLRLIAGFIKPDSGEIYINGEPQSGKPPYQRNIGVVFQNYALFPHMTVEENVAFGLKMRKVRDDVIKKKVSEALDLVMLSGLEKRYPKELSGGQQQRVALARALVIEPDVLLLDEPLSNLDLKLRLQMRYEIKRLQKIAGITTVYVTHDQGEALAMSDLIAVMNQGRILQLGTPWDIYNNPTHEFVAEFIGETNIIKGVVREVSQNNMNIELDGGIILSLNSRDNVLSKFHSNEEVIICIRPEHLNLVRGNFVKIHQGSTNLVKAKIIEKIYLGSYMEYLVKLPNTKVIKIRSEEVFNTFNIGDDCYLKFDSSKFHIIKKQQ
ncbi:MAG: ABC transporter ATP-binding protein [Nitrososphaerota archaeon]